MAPGPQARAAPAAHRDEARRTDPTRPAGPGRGPRPRRLALGLFALLIWCSVTLALEMPTGTDPKAGPGIEPVADPDLQALLGREPRTDQPESNQASPDPAKAHPAEDESFPGHGGPVEPEPQAGARQTTRPSPFLDRFYSGPGPGNPASQAKDQRDEIFDQRFQIIHAAGLQEGMRVAVVGADQGLIGAHLARAVGPEGQVYALDLDPESSDAIARNARDYRVTNLEPGSIGGANQVLTAESIDLAILLDTYHRLEDPQALVAALHAALGAYGRLIVIEPRGHPGLGHPGLGSGRPLDRDRLVSELESAGFRLVDEPQILTDNEYLRLEKVGGLPDMEVGPIETSTPP